MLQGGVEPGWEGRVHSWHSRGGWGGGGGNSSSSTAAVPPPSPRPAWTDTNKEVDQADDEEELTTDDDEKDNKVGSFQQCFGSRFREFSVSGFGLRIQGLKIKFKMLNHHKIILLNKT